MPGNGSVFDLCGTLANRDNSHDRSASLASSAVVQSVAYRAGAAQVRNQLFLQHATRLDEEAAVNRLVRHPHTFIVAIGSFKPSGDLLRRPVNPELLRDLSGQSRVLGQPASLRPPRVAPGLRIGLQRPITAAASVTSNLAAKARGRPAHAPGHRANRVPCA